MTTPERTRQQLDPAGTAELRLLTICLSAGSVAYAIVMTARGVAEVSNPVLSIVAIVVLAVAASAVIVETSSPAVPFSAGEHAVIHVLALAAVGLQLAAQWGSDAFAQNDWGPVSFGVLIVAIGPYRPPREIASAGVLSAIFVGFLTLIKVPEFGTPGPPVAFLVLSVTPMVALALASAVFSDGIIRSITGRRNRSRVDPDLIDRDTGDGIERSVREDRTLILERDVLPFFTDVLSRTEIGEPERLQARAIADSIRRVMVQEVDRSWLESAIELIVPGASAALVSDPDRIADLMATDQRIALRALLAVVLEARDVGTGVESVTLSRTGRGCDVELLARIDIPDAAARSVFAPYFGVIRAVFRAVDVDVATPSLRLRFSYDHH